ncbi:hypothetical protein NUW58_g9484 [Xylaria curta]|uniref:Uncharacterized protein n=1 Tax=Xylaria curta TaxID=42375 RepID=A0ACC1MWZ9_9PEZI|nr:hypothetical protein NUW58_g9484 [Xylaria curta]
MSFGYAVGDVIAVLGLFERVAIELRNYKNAPAHFQQLSAELDLLRSTLQHVLQIRPETSEEQQTLEKVRAIAIHCLQPLRTLSAKMEAKQSSLGHFHTSGTLRVMRTRLHRSMVEQKDVDELRKTVLSEIVAINMLLSVQQLAHIKQLSAGVRKYEGQLSTTFDAQANALLNQTSMILDLVGGTPDAIASLHALTTAQAEEQARQTKFLFVNMKSVMSRIGGLSLEFSATSAAVHRYIRSARQTADNVFRLMQDIQRLIIFLVTCTKEMLEAIARNTRMLLDIANHMKRIVKSIEAIPLHLTVGIVRLDDALGVSWGLPIQACSHWDSFHNLLKSVVFANGRAGAQKVQKEQFVITLSKTGQQVNSWDWEKTITEGAHIEQAMMVEHTSPDRGQQCLGPGCNGTIVNGVGNRSNSKSCLSCSQLVIPLDLEDWVDSHSRRKPVWPEPESEVYVVDGLELDPRIHVAEGDIHNFHRVCVIELDNVNVISMSWNVLDYSGD